MSKAEKEKVVHILPLGSVRSESGRKTVVLIAGPDHETNREALRDFAMGIGATEWESQDIDSDGNPTGGRSFYFSGDKWTAPWQPEGPRGNWGYKPPEKADPTKPIS